MSFLIGKTVFNYPKWNDAMTEALRDLPEPEIGDQDTEKFSHDSSIVFQEAESVYLDVSMESQPVRFYSTHSVSTCIVAYLYNEHGERFALHHSFNDLDWKDILGRFKHRESIKLMLIGGLPTEAQVSYSDSFLKVMRLVSTLYIYVLNNRDKLKLTIVAQKLLDRNALKKVDIHASVANSVQQILNKISLHFFRKPSEIRLNHAQPKKNFVRTTVEGYNASLIIEALQAMEVFKTAHPQFNQDQFKKLAEMLCTERGFKQLEESLYPITTLKPQLTDFAFNLLNHRVIPIDAPQIIPMSEMRQAYFISHLFAEESTPQLLQVVHPKGVEQVCLSREFIKAIHEQSKNLPALQASFLKQETNDEVLSKFVALLKNMTIKHKKQMERRLIQIIEYYLGHPDHFITTDKELLGMKLIKCDLEENLRKLCAQANLDQIKQLMASSHVLLDVNAQGAVEKRTPLHMVLVKATTICKLNAPGFEKCLEIIKYLLSLHARVDIPNKEEKTVLDLAKELSEDTQLSEKSLEQAKNLLVILQQAQQTVETKQ